MAELDVTRVGSYTEFEGKSVYITRVGTYIELDPSMVYITRIGAYVEFEQGPITGRIQGPALQSI